jgi:hypothetical protein
MSSGAQGRTFMEVGADRVALAIIWPRGGRATSGFFFFFPRIYRQMVSPAHASKGQSKLFQ